MYSLTILQRRNFPDFCFAITFPLSELLAVTVLRSFSDNVVVLWRACHQNITLGLPCADLPCLNTLVRTVLRSFNTTIQRDVRKDAGKCWAAERLSRFLYLKWRKFTYLCIIKCNFLPAKRCSLKFVCWKEKWFPHIYKPLQIVHTKYFNYVFRSYRSHCICYSYLMYACRCVTDGVYILLQYSFIIISYCEYNSLFHSFYKL